MSKVGTLIVSLSISFLCSGQVLFANEAVQAAAFPGAEGAGKYSVGGRGGGVLEITNLDDSGPGSLRNAVEADGPRIVVFRVSGNIELQSNLTISNPYITIAGQTAPGDGICLKNYSLIVSADDVVIQYLRVRPSDNSGKEIDAIGINSGENIIIDHCSASWGVDEVLSIGPSPGGPNIPSPDNVTVQWCMITEGLNNSVHPKGEHGYGTLAKGGFGSHYTFHHNLYAHHKARCPYASNYNDVSIDPMGLTFDFRNNVIYNWGDGCAGYNTQHRADSVTRMNFVANYYKPGPNTTGSCIFFPREPESKGYFANNWIDGSCPEDSWSGVRFDPEWTQAQIDSFRQSKPVAVKLPVATDETQIAYEKVLADAGAALPVRDMVDRRIVENVRSGTGRIIDDEDEVGGWPELKSVSPAVDSDHDGMPDDWERVHGLNPSDPNDGKTDSDGDGYTNVEQYLNDLCKS